MQGWIMTSLRRATAEHSTVMRQGRVRHQQQHMQCIVIHSPAQVEQSRAVKIADTATQSAVICPDIVIANIWQSRLLDCTTFWYFKAGENKCNCCSSKGRSARWSAKADPS